MTRTKITASGSPPVEPPHDMEVRIAFVKDKGSPSRIFLAATDMIQALEEMDRVLIKSISSEIKPLMMLEDVEVGSLKIILKNVLNQADDEALKSLDWKPLVGQYLVKAKYLILRWADDEEPTKSLPDLRKRIQALASETDVRRLPDYAPVDPTALMAAVQKVQSSKEKLIEGDALFYNGDGTGEEYELDMSVHINADSILDIATKLTEITPPMSMILAVKKPDYLGSSKWEMRHGKRVISVRINDETFLREFQARKIDVRPKDALKCMVQVEMKYGYDNELISETFVIVSVTEILQDNNLQGDMFED